MLDSLVRVTRRAGSNHFLSIPSVHGPRPTVARSPDSTASSPTQNTHQSPTHPAEKAYTVISSVLSTTRYAGYNKHRTSCTLPPYVPYPAETRTDAELRTTTTQRRRPKGTTAKGFDASHTRSPRAIPTERWSHINTGLIRFPFSNFKYFLTLFSKFFASFPHGTCSLSVSRPYLALDGIYHPF